MEKVQREYYQWYSILKVNRNTIELKVIFSSTKYVLTYTYVVKAELDGELTSRIQQR